MTYDQYEGVSQGRIRADAIAVDSVIASRVFSWERLWAIFWPAGPIAQDGQSGPNPPPTCPTKNHKPQKK